MITYYYYSTNLLLTILRKNMGALRLGDELMIPRNSIYFRLKTFVYLNKKSFIRLHKYKLSIKLFMIQNKIGIVQ